MKSTGLLYNMSLLMKVGPGPDEVIIVVSSLMKDMTSKVDLYRSNAIRVLCSIADSQVLGNIERYFKQASPPFGPPKLRSNASRLQPDMHTQEHGLPSADGL